MALTQLELHIKSHWQILIFLIFSHLGGSIIVFILDLPLYIKISLWVFIIFYFHKQLKLYYLFTHHQSIVKIKYLVDDKWIIEFSNQRCEIAQLCGESFIHPFMIILNFHFQQRPYHRSAFVLTNAQNKNHCRLLRVFIKINKAKLVPSKKWRKSTK